MDNSTLNNRRTVLYPSLLLKVVTILLLSFFSPNVFAQLDLIHYVPPLYAGTTSNGDIGDHWVVLTTPSEEAITVTIKRGDGTLLAEVPNVSINTPQRFYFENEDYGNSYGTINRPTLNVINSSSLNKALTDQGLIFTSTQAFYVNIRHKSAIHGLSLTAKGQAALGTSFRSGHLYSVRGENMSGWGGGYYSRHWPYSWHSYSTSVVVHRSHFISVMATEDNTKVTFSDIKVANLTSDTKHALPVTGDISVTLNAGESYVIGADLKYLEEDEANSLNGTKISSDKPIAVNSGSWCGGTGLTSSQDIGVDQIVPEKSVGREYILLKGKGNNETERPIVVATQDNTDVFVNGSTSKIKTLDHAGDSYAIPTSQFINGVMLIKTNEDVYLYQTTSASDKKTYDRWGNLQTDYAYATVGMNFIPPLSALGFRQVDIPYVTELGVTGIIAIYAQKGSDVYVNGSETALDSPLAVTGNEEWVVYKYVVERAYVGEVVNISVKSDKAIYVAMSVEDDAVGAAGYFSGFTKSISPINPDIAFSYDLGYVCSSKGDDFDLAINSTPTPDLYEWYEAKDPTDLLLFKDQNLNVKVSELADKYILKAYFRDPNMDILYNGDFAIGWGSSLTDLDDTQVFNLEDPGKVILTANPKSINNHFADFKDLDDTNGKMLLAHSSGNGRNDVIWKQTVYNDIPDNLFILKFYGRLAEAGTNQYLDVYVNDDKILTNFQLNDVNAWKSVKAFWEAGSAESAEIRIVDANQNGADAVFAIDSISFVPAIEATKEYNPNVVPNYTYTSYTKGFHMCEGAESETLDISYGDDMEWFTFLWEKQVSENVFDSIPKKDSITGLNTYKLVFNDVAKKQEGVYRCTIDFKETYESCGIDAESISFIVNVYVDQPATLAPLSGETKLCYGVSSEISTVVSGDPSVIKWAVYKEGETTAIDTLDNFENVYKFNSGKDYEVGNYTVRCEVVNGCSSGLIKTIDIEILGRAKLESLNIPTNLCETKEITLSAGLEAGFVEGSSKLEYAWYKNSDASSLGTSFVPTYNITPAITDESYKVKVYTHYNYGLSNQLTCEGNSIEKSLVDYPIDPEIKIINQDPISICEGKSHTFTVVLYALSDSYTYDWDVPEAAKVGKSADDFTNRSFSLSSVNREMAGDYTVTVSNNCDSKSFTYKLSVTPKLLVTGLSALPAGPYCLNKDVTITINGNANAYVAENLGTNETINIAGNTFTIKVNTDTEGQWEVTAQNSCGADSKVISINLVDGFSAPYITSREACVGGNATLEAVVVTPPEGTSLTYQWKDQLGNELVGETNSILEFNPVALADAGEYTCVVSDGICSTQYAKGTLSVDDITSILKQGSVDVCEGQLHRFEIYYEGNPTFAWYFNGTSLGVSTSYYEISSVAMVNDGLYSCVINSACGEEKFEQRLNVIENVKVSEISDLKIDICEGESAELAIEVDGTPLSVKWFKDEVELTKKLNSRSISTGQLNTTGNYVYKYVVDGEGDCFDPDGTFEVIVHDKPSISVKDVTSCEGNIPLSMTITGTDYMDASWLKPDKSLLGNGTDVTIAGATYADSQGNYTAKVSTKYCKDITTPAEVRIFEPITLLSPVQENVEVCVGTPLKLAVDASGVKSYNWYKLPDLLEPIHIGKNLDLGLANSTHIGNYRCVLISENDCSDLSININVDVQERPTFSLSDFDECSDKGPAIFDATATGDGDYTYKWFKKGDPDDLILNSAKLEITDIVSNNGNSYYCKVTDDVCSTVTTREVNLTVKEGVDINTDPIDRSIAENGNVDFSVKATGTNLSYQWFVNTGAGFTSMGNTPTSAQLNKLVLTNVPFSYNGNTYYCKVTNDCESKDSKTATLTVTGDNRITSVISNAKACVANPFTFTVGYNDTTDGCTWEYDDDNDGVYDVIGGLGTAVYGTTSSTLTVTTATLAMNSWKFRARVKRSTYTDNISEDVSVKVYPKVSYDLVGDLEICKKAGAAFKLESVKGDPTQYSWTRGTTEISDLTKLNLTAPVDITQTYHVSVSNEVCPALEKDFKILNFEDLVLNEIAGDNLICFNEPTELSISVNKHDTELTEFDYLWKKDGADLGNITDKYTVTADDIKQSGSYSVDVSDACMTVSKTLDVVVLEKVTASSTMNSEQNVCMGSDLTLVVDKLTGADLHYKWYKESDATKTSLGNDEPIFKIVDAKAEDAFTYCCEVSSTQVCGVPVVLVVKFTVSVHNLTAITKNPDDFFECSDYDKANFVVEASGSGTLTYQWYDKEGKKVAGVTDPSELKSVLTIPNADLGVNNGNSYYCEVSSSLCNTEPSLTARLDLKDDVAIIDYTKKLTVPENGKAEFSVIATGTNLKYQWFKKGSPDQELVGETTNILSIDPVLVSDAGDYYCIVKSDCGEASAEATLIVTTVQKFVSDPINRKICFEDDYFFTVEYKKAGNMTCDWEIDKNDGNGFVSRGTLGTVINTAVNTELNSNTLTINSNVLPGTDMNGWIFRAVVFGDLASETSNEASVRIFKKIVLGADEIVDLCPDSKLQLEINLPSDERTFVYLWQDKNSVTRSTSDKLDLDVDHIVDGIYTLEVNDGVCTIEPKKYTVGHYDALVINDIADETICYNDSKDFVIEIDPTSVKHKQTPTYTWNKAGTDLGIAINTLTVLNDDLAKEGTYQVSVYDGCQTKTDDFDVTASIEVTASIDGNANLELCEGDSHNLLVTTTGVDLTYKWTFDPTNPTDPAKDLTSVIGNKLELKDVTTADAGVYRCEVSSLCLATPIVLEYNVIVRKHGAISLQPSSFFDCLAPVEFKIAATGAGTLTYQWYDKDDTEIAGATSNSYSIAKEDLPANDDQSFYCKVITQYCDDITSNKATLNIKEAVEIVNDPEDVILVEGTDARFEVEAKGYNLSYQWFKNTEAIPGETNAILNLIDVKLDDADDYVCEVIGDCGSIKTGAALIVNKESRITLSASDKEVCEDLEFFFEIGFKNTSTDCVWEVDKSDGLGFVDASTIGDVSSFDKDTPSRLTIHKAEVEMANWKFRARVEKDGYSNDYSNEVKVTVYEKTTIVDIPNVEICRNENASFELELLTGKKSLSYVWKKGTDEKGSNLNLNLDGVTDDISGNYSVSVMSDFCPTVEDEFSVSYYKDLALNDLIHDTELCPTDDINLSVVIATGPAKFANYSWTKDDVDLGITTVSYEKLNVTDLESGLYEVTVEDKCMIQSKSIRIDILDIITKVSDEWEDESLCVGDALLFEAIVTGDSPVYTWSVPDGVTDPGNVATFNVDEVTEANEGPYECSVQGTCGDPVVYSANVLVNDVPNITTGLSLSAVCVGEALELGPIVYDATRGESILWKFENSDISGSATSLDLGMAEITEEGNYRVEVSNACGTDFSVGYQDVYPLPTLEPFADRIVCQGDNVVFRAETTGVGLTYTWMFDGVVDHSFDDKPEFIISNIQPEDVNTLKVHKVECLVSSCDTDLRATANVTVNPTTILNKSLRGEVVYVGEPYVFELDVTGSNLIFEWHHSKADGSEETLSEVTNTLTIESLSLEDAGEYYCNIMGDCGTRFTSGYLTVKDPLHVITGFSTKPIELCEGLPLNLNISVEGEVFSTKWFKDDVDLKHNDELNFSISSLTLEDAGTYTCKIVGEGARVEEVVKVNVLPNTVLNSSLKDQTLCEGKDDLFWSADVSGASLTYIWKDEDGVVSTSNNLLIAKVPVVAAGLYTVDVKGTCGDVSTEAYLTVKSLPRPDTYSKDLDLCENDDEAIFTATFTGDDLRYQWQKDGVDIKDANSTTLKIQNLRVDDAGDYTCIASSLCGSATSEIMNLKVTPQLEILSETPGMDVCDGEDAQFEIEVEGNDVVYQWQKDGVDITGENASLLTISPASLTEEGYYSCAVTDRCTTTKRYSNSKKLTVNALPESTISGRLVLCVFEDRVAYSTALQPDINYGWLVNGGEFTTPAEGVRTKVTWGDGDGESYLNLIITNEATGCTSKLNAPVELHPLPTVTLSSFKTKGICENDSPLAGGYPAGGIYWVDGVAQNSFDPGQGNGQYNVRYSYTDEYGCSNTTGENVLIVDSLPIVKIMDDVVVVGTCETKQLSATTDEDNILWSPNLYLDDRNSTTPTFTAGESTLYVATVVDDHGCKGNDIINVTVAPLPTITTINDTIIGECKEIELTTVISGDIDEITWTNPGDLDEPDNSNPMLINRQVGVTDYQINVTDKYGCVASGTVKVEVLPNPEVGESQNLCEGESLVIDTRDLSNPVWSDGFSDWERTIDKPGEYELRVEQNDCELVQKIVMNPTPKFELDHTVHPGIVIFQGETVTLEPDLNPDFSPYVYDWNDGSVLSQLVVSESGVYKLTVQDKFGCVATDTVEVLVKPIGIESPDAFTPLSDNENDRFYLKDINVTDDFKMYIYNRWGELIYEASEPGYAGGWDGTYRGEDCPVGTYVWIVFLDGKEKEKGTVTLLR